ncbi:MAG: tetratricopeptide repeat protein [Verrucomicrobiota bacterium]|nr:tetratricopeptide repeat protein [Verrucomicrobiota bacterium]
MRETFNVQGWRLLPVLLLLVSLAVCSLGKAQDLAEAVRPLTDGVPQVAVVRLRALLAREIPAEERRAASAKLGEALVAAGEFEEALKILRADDLRDLPATAFFQAQALAGLSRWSEAWPLYQKLGSDAASPFYAEALFGEAESLRALNRFNDAVQILEILRQDPRWNQRATLRSVELVTALGEPGRATRLLDSVQPISAAERNEKRFLRGRIQAELGRNSKAIQLFASILKKPEGATQADIVATLFAIADAHLRTGAPGTGDDFLEDFIEHQPTDPELPAIFAKLDQLYAAEKKPSRHELGRWSRDSMEPRRALALWYLARAELRLGHRDEARQTFALLRAHHPPLPALAEAFLEDAQLELDDRKFDEVTAILELARAVHPAPEVLDRINLLAGRNEYDAKKFTTSAQMFQRVAHSGSPHARVALFDASLAWLEAGDALQVASASEELEKSGADEQTRGDLRLEEGLVSAGRGEKKAEEVLRGFLKDFPRHPRASEAWVSLAELAFQAAPPQLEEARRDLARAAENKMTSAASERADYLTIWIEEAAATPNEEKVVALATEFLRKHETSALLPEVRLKLAETYYRRQDFASARTQFEILAQRNPDSPIAEKAQFFAAQSARQSMGPEALEQALVSFDAVVKRNGEFKWAARNEQAVIERKLGKPDDATTLYDEVLKGDAQPSEKREALCGKGDILYELGAKDPENYRRAIELYGQLAGQTDAAAHWRNQAQFKKGMCLEKLDQPTEALAAFYQIIEEPVRPDRSREFFWFYKAGFNAARILETDSKWQPAAAIYEKLSFAGGARSEEAKARLNRLRLEHFLWD